MKNFEELKNELLEKVKEFNPCSSQKNRVVNAKNEEELLQIIYENIEWCNGKNVISHEYFSHFNPETYLNSGLTNTGKENTGFINSGDSNSGDRNSGYRNSGDSNSGDRNSGDRNSGNWNSGDRNSGNWNSGYRNSGDSNSGYRNSGNWNSGDSNSGNWNSGDRNSGDSNSGYRNSGAFCTDQNPKAILFNRESSMTVKEWENSKAFNIMVNHLNFTFWIYENNMNDQEKKDHPKYETTGGYLKTISVHEGWVNMWGNLSDNDKKAFTEIENFSAEIFEEITGIKI